MGNDMIPDQDGTPRPPAAPSPLPKQEVAASSTGNTNDTPDQGLPTPECLEDGAGRCANPLHHHPENRYLPASVTLEEAISAYDAWGANCGPGALAAAIDMTLDYVRPHLVGFDMKRYTNPMMMLRALRELGLTWRDVPGWPVNGLVRVQWGGPWMKPGVPIRARYRHTHWIATRLTGADLRVFDINGACTGWMPFEEWSTQLVPWLLGQVSPRNDGTWHATHRLELTP